MSKGNSYRQILRSSSIIGGASVINILVGLLRMKVAAVLLGPAGIGLIGLLQSLLATASAVSAMGVGMVGTRQIAEASGRDDTASVTAARRALFWGTLALAMIGAIVFWSFRDALAMWLLADGEYASAIGWLSVGVALTVASGSQGALLNGLRRIGDIARISVMSALLSTALGMAALWLWSDKGVLAFVLVTPLASFLFGHWYVAKLPKVQGPATPLPQLMAQCRTLVRLGAPFMVSALVVTFGQLAVRTLVQSELGANALGHFQAAWMISMTYIGFVLGAMATDYYPRLTATIHDHATVNRLVNEQTEVALLLAGPIFLPMIGLAPWVIELLYSNSFHAAADVLSWLVLGDILKLASWPLGFIILAAGDGRTFMLTEFLAAGVFVLLTWLVLPLMGVVGTGMAFVGMYMVYLPMVYWLARRKTGFRWVATVWQLVGWLVLAAVALVGAAKWSALAGAAAGLIMSASLGLYSFSRLAHKTSLTGQLGRLARFCRRWLMKIGVRID